MQNKDTNTVILGAGVSGLAAGIKTGATIFEASDKPGGLCQSYAKNGYQFLNAGGHWLFGNDQKTIEFINKLTPLNFYKKNSAVFFPQTKQYIQYPIQNHLDLLPVKIAQKIKEEIKRNSQQSASTNLTTQQWLENRFGSTLCQLFFFPFQSSYTADLYTKIAPEDQFKNPDKQTQGYNDLFAYPENGINDLIDLMAQKCKIEYKYKVVEINTNARYIFSANGKKVKYKRIISTIPLNKMLELTGLSVSKPAPYTSVLIVNIGALKGAHCPSCHWLYLPKTKSGFYRVGFYSNVDPFFSPQNSKDKVSLYVERAYLSNSKPSQTKINKICQEVVRELQDWKFIAKPKVVDSHFIETAYTWSYPSSNWKEQALALLVKRNIHQIGRYGKWQFQGILESIKEGLEIDNN